VHYHFGAEIHGTAKCKSDFDRVIKGSIYQILWTEMFDTCNADNIIKISAQQAYIKYLELFI